MKKTLFLWGGVIALTLAGCSEDAYNIVEATEEEIPYKTNSFNEDQPGFYDPPNGPSVIGDNYFSPWDIKFRSTIQPSYIFMNGHLSSPFELRLIPMIGLAYYDGQNDGRYHDSYEASFNPPALIADFNNGNYPNLYANGNEIGELIPAKTIILDGSQSENCEVAIRQEHCPVNPIAPLTYPQYNPKGRFFDISHIATPQEQSLLAEYGKVFFYRYMVIRKSDGLTVGDGILQVHNETIKDPVANPYWADTGIHDATLPTGATTGKLRYYYNTAAAPPFTEWNPNQGPNAQGVWCDSREVDYEPVYHSEENLIGGGTITLYMGMGTGLWQTSGHVISLQP